MSRWSPADGHRHQPRNEHRVARRSALDERLLHFRVDRIDVPMENGIMLEGPNLDGEEILENLMECDNAGPGAYPSRLARAAVADRSRPGLPDAPAVCLPGKVNAAAPSVFA